MRDESPAIPAIAFDHVSLAFDDTTVLHDVSFRVADGDLAILLGPSGAGKSVLLKLALGLLQPDAGTIAIYGQRLERLSERALLPIRDHIGMLFQESALFDSLTVGENVGFKLEDEARLDASAIAVRVLEVLRFVGLEPYVDRLPGELSGGQRRRVAIARAIAGDPRLLLLDDPTVGLDPITARSVITEIVKLRDLRKVSALVVTHQLQDAFYLATHAAMATGQGIVLHRRDRGLAGRTHVLVLREGVVSFDGTMEALMESRDPWIVTALSGWIPDLSLGPSSVPPRPAPASVPVPA